MKYVKIVSKSVTTPEDLFTLGVSTSRGKEDKIGQFGSGTLLGTLAWLRVYGTSPVFMVNGKKVTFETKDVLKSDGETFKQVLMCQGRKKSPLNVALEYGTLDWPTACLGLREWISNAIDAGATPDNLLVLTNKIEATEDEVAVFVPYTELAKEYFDNIGKYFLHFSGKETETVVEKDSISPCRVYRKGVFIRELMEESLFDYNLNISINECRTGSSDSIVNDIEYHITFYEKAKSLLEKVRDAVLTGRKVTETAKTYSGMSYTMTEVWKDLIGTVGLCPTNFLVANCTPIDPEWHKNVVRSVPELNGLHSLCEAEIKGFSVSPPSETILKHYHKFCELIETLGMSVGLDRPELIVYNTVDDEQPSFLGLYDLGKKQIMIWEKNPRLSETMVHELAHHYTRGADDHSPRFAAFGHNLVAAIMSQLM